jgi:hypothetical protein
MRDYQRWAEKAKTYAEWKAANNDALKRAANNAAAMDRAAEESKKNNSKYFVLNPSDLEAGRRLKTYRKKRD